MWKKVLVLLLLSVLNKVKKSEVTDVSILLDLLDCPQIGVHRIVQNNACWEVDLSGANIPSCNNHYVYICKVHKYHQRCRVIHQKFFD